MEEGDMRGVQWDREEGGGDEDEGTEGGGDWRK